MGDIIPTQTHGWLFSIFDPKFTFYNKKEEKSVNLLLSSSPSLKEFSGVLAPVTDRSIVSAPAFICLRRSFRQVSSLAPS
jgi:hypothetical protein